MLMVRADLFCLPSEITIDMTLKEIVSSNLSNLIDFVYAGSDKVDDSIADLNNDDDDEWLLNK